MTTTVTMECAGNGRARLVTAADLAAVARRGGRHRRVDGHPPPAVARGGRTARRGGGARVRRCRSRDPQGDRARLRAQPPDRRCPARRGPARVRDERRPAPAAARVPAPPGRSRLVRDDERQMADTHHRRARTVRGLPAVGLSVPPRARGRRDTRHADGSPLAHDPARHPGLHDAEPHRRRRTPRPARPCLVRVGLDRAGRGERRRGLDLDDRGARRCALAATRGVPGRSTGMPGPAPPSSAAGRRTRRATCSRSSRRGTSAGSRTTRCSASRSRSARRA